ncbi:Myb-like_DNA-binding domain-containing protein [Hexamita inflata]|uniref:Myb-like DNA-binding domain-containing protein n=1 Tax=Hexamita inflata TaxID=28002 RepID=A0AA86QMW6_9EUKA|nr:Myb-like DNA-binding domain-containing protein [Hexamita inflata]CAI9962609.1 Myb-like DNA-binding domain-containing protein [Hexamita inflata]
MPYHNWTKQEINLLSSAVKKHGLKWEIIQNNYFPEFNTISVKNKYYAVTHEILKRRKDNAQNAQSATQDKQIVNKTQQQAKNESNTLSEDDILQQIRMILDQPQQ